MFDSPSSNSLCDRWYPPRCMEINLLFHWGFSSIYKLSLAASFCFPGILETYWDKHSVIASTPPPSPTSGETGECIYLQYLQTTDRCCLNCNHVFFLFCLLILQLNCWAVYFRVASTQSCCVNPWQHWTVRASSSVVLFWSV